MQRAYPWLTAIFLLGCLALGCLLVRQKTEILQLGLKRSTSDQDARLQAASLERQLAAAKAARAKAEKELALAKPKSPGGPRSSADDGGSMRTIHVSDIVKDHPEYAPIFNRQTRRNVLRNFGPGIAALNLPPEQAAKLKDLLVERELSANDAQHAAEAAGLARGSAGYRDAVKQAQAGVEQEVTTLLGTDGGPVIQRLQTASSAQNQVQNSYAPDLADAGAALTSDQSAALAQAIANSSYAGKDLSTRPADYNQLDQTTWLTPHDNRIISQAAATLSPAQVEVIKTDLMQGHQQSTILQEYTAGATGGVRIVP